MKPFIYMICIAFAFKATAQEQLRPLSSNMQLMQEPVDTKMLANKTSTSTILAKDTLPFFDDFSYAYKSTRPTAKHWLDSNVYINTGFAKAPISLGVATFDGLNKKGYPYQIGALVSSSGVADLLTSRPINLHHKGSYVYSPADSLYLSFYYQAEGNGEAPEASDSLSLDLFKPRQNKWVKTWGRKGYNPTATDTNFYRVMIAIKDTAYLDSAFQFRFRNNATLSGSLDHWNLDYVFMDINRTKNDTVKNDITFAYKPTPFLKNYFTMPRNQYNAGEMATTFKNSFRSNFTTNVFMDYKYAIYDKTNTQLGAIQSLGIVGNPGVQPFINNGYHAGMPHSMPTLTLSYPTLGVTDTLFTIKHIVQSIGDVYKSNDTVICTQKFTNYYAHDDGTAEVGYYNNTFGAKIASRFSLNVNDTLKAVRIYFDPITNGILIQNSTFRVMIWSGSSGTPGSVIYRDSVRNPQYLQGTYNMIPTYSLTSCLPLNAGIYFIGIQQTSNLALNIGFDRNTNHINALYYDIGNGFVASTIPGGGSLMINPVMGCYEPLVVGVKENKHTNEFSVYPNPAQNEITIQTTLTESLSVTLFSALGQEVIKETLNDNKTISVSNLPNGIYYILISSKLGNVSTKKIVIAR